MRRVLIAGAIVLGGLYLIALAALWAVQRDLFFQPSGEWSHPADASLDGEAVEIATLDGERLRGWHVPARAGRALFVYFHGNAGSLSNRAARFRGLAARGDGLLAVALRGYPGSSGDPSEAGFARDADAVYAKALGLGYGADRIVLIGESMGSGVAVALAARRPVAALALDSPFSSAVDVAASAYWMFPVRLLMRDPMRSDRAIAEVKAPLLIVHGSADEVVPIGFGRRLFALAREPKTFLELPGETHLAMETALERVLDWSEAVRRPR
ncbi:MAG: alpha/beta hydrolase [Rhizobiales bacterium]|nr:alpha/beta hydrolase [Hyphomicrobiales bacterium]